VLAAGLPLIAFLQLVRVHGQALAQIADAEVRLFHASSRARRRNRREDAVWPTRRKGYPKVQ
jgi:hypothetical protein